MKKQGIRRIISLILLFTFMLGSLLPANVAWAEEMGQEQLATLDESAESAGSTGLIEECSEEASLNEDTTMLDDSEQVAEYDDGNASDINEVEPFIETFGLMASGSDDEKFDIVFLLDRSGSMTTNDPNKYRIQGTAGCIEMLGDNDRAAIMEFDSNVRSLKNLTNSKEELIEAVNKVGAYGSTRIYNGLNAALDNLETNGRNSAYNVIILLTDGVDDQGTVPAKIEAINERAIDAGIIINCIGFGSCNAEMLERLSQPSGGLFVKANSANDVEQAFMKILDYIGKYELTGKDSKERNQLFFGEFQQKTYLYADPINTASGAHVITLPIFRVNGTYSYDFNLRYNSLLTDEGSLGNGWSHDFGARLEFVTDRSINVYWNTNNYNRFYSTDGVNFSSYNVTVVYDKLVKNTDGTYTLVKPNQGKYEFDAQGRLVAKTNRIGQQLQLSYTDDQLTAITDPISDTVVTLSYNENGFINQIIDAGNREYEFTYDSDNNLSQIKNVSLNQTLNYTYNEDGQVLTGSKNGSIIFENTYDEEGRVVVQADGNGNLSYFAYDEETKLGAVITTITDRGGNTRVVEHDANYNLVKAVDGNNGTTEYTYDAKGNMLTHKNARGYTTTYTYDERGNLLTIEDAKGRVTRMSYDARNNLKTIKDALGKTTSFAYDSNNRLTSLTDPRGEITSFTYDENGLLLQETLPGGGVTSYTYENGLPETITAPAGVSLTYEYDQAGRIVGITDSAGTTTFTYDAGDKVTSITDPLGNTVTREYDQHGNLIKTTDAQGKVTRYAYDANDNLIALTDPLNQTVQYEYDNEDRLEKVIDARGNATTMVYDGLGRMTGVTDPLGNTFKYVYDEEGNLREVTDAYDETISEMTYDEVGNLLATTDALGNTVTSEYDVLNRLIESINPLGRTTQLAYNENNELTMVTDALGGESSQDFDIDGNRSLLVNTNNGETTFVYNPAGQLTSISTEAGQQVQFSYNDRGLLASVTNGRGQQATYEYDAAGRVTQYIDPTGTISYTYDANGNLLTVTDAQGTITRAYDDLGRITRYTNADGQQIQYAYDEVGNLISLTYPGGKQVHYTYDAANRLIKVEDWAGRITQYEYDNNGRLTKTIRPNQTVLTQTYNAAGQLLEQKDLDKDGRVISSYTFEYDAVGNIVSEASPYLAPSVSLQNIPNINMTYTEDNRLATFNGQAVQFDADGNMITGPLNGQMASYTYDSRNRLVAAGNLTYEYDAENNRIGVTEDIAGSPVKTEYVVNPNAALSQVLIKTVGNEQTYYVYGLGLIGQEVAGEYSSYHFDLRGSTVAITNANGKVTDRYQYSAYGEILSSSGNTDTPFLYNGRDGVMTDANGLYYMRARYYNPEIRRFVSQDILLGVVIDGQSLNRYAYVQGNPVGFVDPLGLARDSWGKNVLSTGIGFAPIAGDIKDIQETLTGVDLITGEKLSTGDRVITGVLIAAPVINGKAARDAIDAAEAGVKFVIEKIGKLFKGAGKTGDNLVYLSKNADGVTQYVGITNNIARRQAEHLASKGIQIEPLMKNLSRSDARAVEQALIEIHGLGKNGGTLINKINSIGKTNPQYAKSLERGYELLKSIGY